MATRNPHTAEAPAGKYAKFRNTKRTNKMQEKARREVVAIGQVVRPSSQPPPNLVRPYRGI